MTTTAERVQSAVNQWEPITFGAEEIAAEIDGLRAQRDEARAQIAALTARAEAWDAEQAYLRIGVRWDYEGGDPAPMIDALDRFRAAAARAREAAKS